MQLYEAASQAINHLKFDRTILWSDSTITLYWINTPLNILKILEFSELPEINGPDKSFDNYEPDASGLAHKIQSASVNEITDFVSSYVTTKKRIEKKFNISEHFSSSNEFKRFTACCKRVAHNARNKEYQTGDLTIKQLNNALTTIIKLIQGEGFPNELRSLKSKTRVEG